MEYEVKGKIQTGALARVTVYGGLTCGKGGISSSSRWLTMVAGC